MLGLGFAGLAGTACGPQGVEPLGRETEAINVCDETVPADRYLDGLPAYAQCDGSNSASIWSNNGIDTATSSLGSDWVRTQQGGGYQCTEWASRYMHFRFAIDYRHGDAKDWCDGTLPATLVKSTSPVHGDLIVFDAGVCGADSTTGHIAVIDTVDTTKAKVTLVEENRAERRSTDASCALCFLHATVNDGSTGGATGAGGAGVGSGGGGAGTAGGGAPGTGGRRAMNGSGGVTSTEAGGRPATGGGGAFASGGVTSARGGASTGVGGRGSAIGAAGSSEAGTAGTPMTNIDSGGRPGASGAPGTGGAAESTGVAGGGTPTAGGAEQPPSGTALPSDTNESSGCSIGARRANDPKGWVVLGGLVLFVRRRRSGSRRSALRDLRRAS